MTVGQNGMADNPLSKTEIPADQLMLVQREAQELFRYLADEFEKQLQYADHELTQTQGLLKDAVETLTTCFTGIHDKVCVPQSRGGDPESPGSKMGHHDTSELESLLNAAIRTLQFQDLTKQLIDHALHRVSAMRQVMNDIKSMSADEARGPAHFMEDIGHYYTSIQHNVANLDEHKTNPVSQGHMMTGEIELF